MQTKNTYFFGWPSVELLSGLKTITFGKKIFQLKITPRKILHKKGCNEFIRNCHRTLRKRELEITPFTLLTQALWIGENVEF